MKERERHAEAALETVRKLIAQAMPQNANGRVSVVAQPSETTVGDLVITARCDGPHFQIPDKGPSNASPLRIVTAIVAEVSNEYAWVFSLAQWEAYVRKQVLAVEDTSKLDAASFATRMAARRNKA